MIIISITKANDTIVIRTPCIYISVYIILCIYICLSLSVCVCVCVCVCVSACYHVGVSGSYSMNFLMIGFTTSSAVQGSEAKTGQYE